MKSTLGNIAHPLTLVIIAAILVFSFTQLAAIFGFSPLMTAGAQALAIGLVLLLHPLELEFVHESDDNSYPVSILVFVLVAAVVVGVLGLAAMAAATYFKLEYVDFSFLFGGSSLLGTFTHVFAPTFTSSPITLIVNLLVGIATCALVAVWEEGFFRGILIPCIIEGVPLRNPRHFAAIATAVVFGLLHLVISANESLMLQGILKALQAGLFGYCMAVYFINTGSLVECIGIHTLFDTVYFAPTILSGGTLSEAWAFGTPLESVQLVLSIVLLLVAAVLSGRQLRPRGTMGQNDAATNRK